MNGTKKLSKLAKDTGEKSRNVNNVKVVEPDKLCRSRFQLDIQGVSLDSDTFIASLLTLVLSNSQIDVFKLFCRHFKNSTVETSINL